MVKNLSNQKIGNVEELKIVYDGPSFNNNTIKLNELSSQLKATDDLIRTCFDVLKEQRKVKEDNKIDNIYLNVNKGSFEECLIICLSNEEIRGHVVNLIFFLISLYLMNKTDKKSDKNFDEVNKKIDLLRQEVQPLIKKGKSKNLLNILEPLTLDEDFVKIEYEHKELIRIYRTQKETIAKRIVEEEHLIEEEIKKEHIKGRLVSLNIETNRFSFYLEKFKKTLPIKTNLTLDDIKHLLGEPLSLYLEIHYELDEPIKIELINYSLIGTKKLNEFT